MALNNKRILATDKQTGAAVPLIDSARVVLACDQTVPWKYLQVEQLEIDALQPAQFSELILRQPLIGLITSEQPLRVELKHSTGSEKILYCHGDLIIHPAGPLVPFKPLSAAACFAASFANRLFEQLSDDKGSSQCALLASRKTTDPFIAAAMYTLKEEVEAGCPGGRMYGDSIATALAAHLLAKYSSGTTDQTATRGGLNHKTLRVVTDFIENNFHQDLTLDELAALVYMSPYHFLRLFKQSTGLTPFQYLLNSRISAAKELLSSGNRQVKQVAHEVGFSNQSHFTRQFKRSTGVNPIDYMNDRR